MVAEDAAGTLLGYGVIDLTGNEVDALFVDPDRSGQGIGRMLLERVEALSDPQRGLHLSASLNAVPFYLRAGFSADGEALYPHPSGIALACMQMHKRGRSQRGD
nr:GNAT family N-acetyltransferase [Stenotrophomonas sp. UBA7606]